MLKLIALIKIQHFEKPKKKIKIKFSLNTKWLDETKYKKIKSWYQTQNQKIGILPLMKFAIKINKWFHVLVLSFWSIIRLHAICSLWLLKIVEIIIMISLHFFHSVSWKSIRKSAQLKQFSLNYRKNKIKKIRKLWINRIISDNKNHNNFQHIYHYCCSSPNLLHIYNGIRKEKSVK